MKTPDDVSGLQIRRSFFRRMLFFYMFLTGLCSFGYELVLERTIVIILGSSSVAMGLVISTFILGYLSSYYFGRWADRIEESGMLVKILLVLESAICVLIAVMVPVLRYSPLLAEWLSYLIFFYYLDYYYVLLFTLSAISLLVPLLMGAEIPFAVKLVAGLKKREEGSVYESVGRISGWVFAFDSLGACVGGLITALVFIPNLGRIHTALVLSVVTLVAGVLLYFSHKKYFDYCVRVKPRNRLKGKRTSRLFRVSNVPVVAFVLLVLLSMYMPVVERASTQALYGGNILLNIDTDYQEIVISDQPQVGLSLYLDGQMQISELDDQMYHEYLVHPAMVSHPCPKNVLVIGGGDGGAVEEILKHDTVEKVTLVELDLEVIDICREYLPTINNGSLDDPRVSIRITDGRIFVREYAGEKFDVIIGDLPDPDTEAVSMLYTQEFFRDVRDLLKEDGVFVLQSASWYEYPVVTMSIYKTLESVFPATSLYVSNVWTFGPWSFSIASQSECWLSLTTGNIGKIIQERGIETRYYNQYTHQGAFLLADNPYLGNVRESARLSTLDRPVLQNPWM